MMTDHALPCPTTHDTPALRRHPAHRVFATRVPRTAGSAAWAAIKAVAKAIFAVFCYIIFFAFLVVCSVVCTPVYIVCLCGAWAAEWVRDWRAGRCQTGDVR